MSTLAVNTITNAAGGNTAQINGMTPTAQSLQGFRNRIINGDMRIDQRNNGASVSTASGSSAYTLDRWTIEYAQTSKFTLQQNAGSVTPPTGFTNYLGVTSSSAYSVGSGDYFLLEQRVEGFNSADLAWGTASAATITVSFWVRSSLTGTFGGAIRNQAGTRSYPFSFTVSAANTWELETITIPGDTSGTWLTNNSIGLRLTLSLGMGSTYTATAGAWATGNFLAPTGSVSVVGTNGATFYITGVQLEAGSVATPFERRDYGRELAMCQRYLPAWKASASGDVFGSGYNASPSIQRGSTPFQVTPRVVPTGITISAAGDFVASSNVNMVATTVVFYGASPTNGFIQLAGAGGQTTGQGGFIYANNTNAQVLFTGCEL